MNFFLTEHGTEPITKNNKELFCCLSNPYRVLMLEAGFVFPNFEWILAHPNIVIKHPDTPWETLKHMFVPDRSMMFNAGNYDFLSIAKAANIKEHLNLVLMVTHIINFNGKETLCTETLDGNQFNAHMRKAIIDEMIESL